MYSYIEGIVTNKFLSSICITINGLGYEVFVLDVELDEWARLCPLFKTWNMKRFLFILIVCEQMALACVAANRTIKGHVVDESGRNVEFASIHVDRYIL